MDIDGAAAHPEETVVYNAACNGAVLGKPSMCTRREPETVALSDANSSDGEKEGKGQFMAV